MNKQWDGLGSRPEDAYRWHLAWAREAFRVLKPGGWMLAFGGTRTVHRLTCAIEDAGFECRDLLMWITAAGFPKSKANLKPAHEPIVLARKPGPLQPLGIDAGRIPGEAWSKQDGESGAGFYTGKFMGGAGLGEPTQQNGLRESVGGRWPSNVMLDPDSAALFDQPNPEVVGSGAVTSSGDRSGEYASGGFLNGSGPVTATLVGDVGGYSRFFVIPKSARSDREPVLRGQLAATNGQRTESGHSTWCVKCGLDRVNVTAQAACQCAEPEWSRVPKNARENAHPTVKPVDLMRHLVRLVTPPQGVVLDPFAGSGSTGLAAIAEGFRVILIEKEPEYVDITMARLNGHQIGMAL